MHQHANTPVRRLPVGHLSIRPTRETAEVSRRLPVAGASGRRGAALVGVLLRRIRRRRRTHPAGQHRSLLALWDRPSHARGCDRTRPVGITVRHAAAQPTGARASRRRTRSRPTAKTSTPSQRSSPMATLVTRYRSREPPMPSMYATIAAKPNGCARQQRPLRISHPCCDWATGQ
jgi:hypothetical protein